MNSRANELFTSDLPTIVIHNNLEVFNHFLKRTDKTELIYQRRFHGDRALFWLGPSKLVIASMPMIDYEFICQTWGYNQTTVITPDYPSSFLSLDILSDQNLMDKIVAYAGPQRTLRLIPYANTREFYMLANTLRNNYGLNVLTPESPEPQNLWIRDYVDTKAGFRNLCQHWINEIFPGRDLLPFAIACRDISQAVEVICWFLAQNMPCVVKSNSGMGGNGNYPLRPAQFAGAEAIEAFLLEDKFLSDDLIMVERYIESFQTLSPSLEFFVPPTGQGDPQITYLSNQVFSDFGKFEGVLIDRRYQQQPWYPTLECCGLEIARKLQELGYAGHFDLDTIVDEEDRIHLLEINARRTGGTFVHEFARQVIGPDYINRAVLLSCNKIKCPKMSSLEPLMLRLSDLLYRPGENQSGVVISASSTLPHGYFSCILVAPSYEETIELHAEMERRLQ
jgi:hypothetical protein